MDDNKTYILDHTAESIDRKLGLIDENKNLLKYPYETDFSEYPALEDVGDGSILTKEKLENAKLSIPLKHFVLPGGKKYVLSCTTTNILDTPNSVRDGNCVLEIFDDSNNNNQMLANSAGREVLDLSNEPNEKAVVAKLSIQDNIDKDLLIKPQIADTVMNTWVPNMDKIGTYVDRRFNSTNTKLRALLDSISDLTTNKAETYNYEVVINSADHPELWTKREDFGYYLCDVSVPGITENDNPIVDIKTGPNATDNALYMKAWSHIQHVETFNNALTLYADEIPSETNFTMLVKVVR